MAGIKQCSRDGCTAAASSGAWCKACRAKYQREYVDTRLAQSEAQGFGKGVEAMRQTLAIEFRRLGMARVTCFEVSEAIARSPRPQLKGS